MTIAPHIAEELANSELCAHLRIIAADAQRLNAADRGRVLCAANEIEIAYRQILSMNEALTEAQARAVALRDRLNALHAIANGSAQWSMGARIEQKWR